MLSVLISTIFVLGFIIYATGMYQIFSKTKFKPLLSVIYIIMGLALMLFAQYHFAKENNKEIVIATGGIR